MLFVILIESKQNKIKHLLITNSDFAFCKIILRSFDLLEHKNYFL